MVHGRFSHFGLPVNWIAADIVLIKDNAFGRALGCDPRRSLARTIKKRTPDVRDRISVMKTTHLT